MEKGFKALLSSFFSSPWKSALFFGSLAFFLRFPFLFRYDNHFGGDSAINYVTAINILNGDYSLYLNGADYISTFEPSLAALVFKVFGPSIPLYGAIMLLEWSLAVGLGAYLSSQGTSKDAGVFAGLTAAVGVPYTMTYTTVPSDSAFIWLSMLLLLEVFLIVEKGGTVPRIFILGLTLGASFFISKKSVPAIIVCIFALACARTAVWQVERLLKPRMWFAFASAVLTGCSPEIWYRLSHPIRQNVFGIAPPGRLVENMRITFKCLLAYFDAQPSSRMQDAFYYWMHLQNLQINPQGAGDHLCALLAGLFLPFVFGCLLFSFSKKKTALFLLSGLAAVNFLLVVVSDHFSPGDNNLPRRYLLPAAVSISVLTGFMFFLCFNLKWRVGRFLALAFMVLFVGRSLFHAFLLLEAPDDLREVRLIVKDMQTHQIDRALGDWGLDYIVMGLTDKKIIVAEPQGHALGSPKDREIVARADHIAFMGGGQPRAGKEIKLEFGGDRYRDYGIDGDVHRTENLWWAPYKSEGPPRFSGNSN